jgi:hypothetical protein
VVYAASEHCKKEVIEVGDAKTVGLTLRVIPGKAVWYVRRREVNPKEGDRRAKMEVEANRFSSLVLMPPPRLRAEIGNRAPSIEHMLSLATKFDVSKDAMARAYAEYHSATIAFVVVRDGKVGATYRNRTRFPFITALRGKPVPERSLFYRKGLQVGVPSDIDSRLPDNWIDVERGGRPRR